MNVFYLTRDLLFSSRLASVARPMAVTVEVIGSADQLRERLAALPTAAVLVDLEHVDAEPMKIMALIGATAPRPTAIAYGPHVKESLLDAARNAGFDLVLNRGQFDQQIGTLLVEFQRKEREGEAPAQ